MFKKLMVRSLTLGLAALCSTGNAEAGMLKGGNGDLITGPPIVITKDDCTVTFAREDIQKVQEEISGTSSTTGKKVSSTTTRYESKTVDGAQIYVRRLDEAMSAIAKYTGPCLTAKKEALRADAVLKILGDPEFADGVAQLFKDAGTAAVGGQEVSFTFDPATGKVEFRSGRGTVYGKDGMADAIQALPRDGRGGPNTLGIGPGIAPQQPYGYSGGYDPRLAQRDYTRAAFANRSVGAAPYAVGGLGMLPTVEPLQRGTTEENAQLRDELAKAKADYAAAEAALDAVVKNKK